MMKIGNKADQDTFGIIVEAISLLDLKGTDVQISRAMTIVDLAAEAFGRESKTTPTKLHAAACKLIHEGH